MPETPEQKARREIDAKLVAAAWLVQDRQDIDLTAGRAIAVREFPMKSGFGFADYLLYIDRKAVGAIEAKAEGPLTGVEAQSGKYAAGLPDNLPAHQRPLPFLFESNGSVTYFTNGRDPKPRSRQVFSFPRPETVAEWLDQPATLRGRLLELPPLEETGLWKVQRKAIANLEGSLAAARPRALIQMATGSGKTFTAVNAAYRLLKFGGAKRLLFLVDRGNLGKQTEDEFANFTPADDTRKFPTLYTVQRLKNNSINPAAKVVITTIQRLYSMLKGEADYEAANEEGSAFDTAKPWKGDPPDVVYSASIPPEFFDLVIVDECHRSIYELWAQVLLYFDAFLVGLTATPAGKTIGFFNKNLVMQYGHDEAVTDGVNVDFDVYRIRTKVTESGATIVADDSGVYVDRRHKLTRAERIELLTQDLTYTASVLDRDVVSEDQIRTVLREFKDKALPTCFPGRGEVPKTLIFAKDDSHADDIVRMVREEFAEQNAFCEKITYRTGFTRVTKKVKNEDGTESEVTDWVRTSSLTPDEILSNFRNSFHPRIAVTVDLISTGTDVKAIEAIFFMRNVKSAGFFEQMKGRGVRVISPDKLRVVTPSATVKDRFIIVDAVGVCEQDKTDSHTLNRQPSVGLPQVLEYVAQGGTDPDALTTLAAQLSQLVTPRVGKADPQASPDAKFIGMEQVEAHTMRLLGTVPAGTMKSAANVFKSGDVLYGRLRAYLNKVYQPEFDGFCSGEFIVLPETIAVQGRFLTYRLNAGDFVQFASHINMGDRPRVDWDQIKVFEVRLPPFNEQVRIADALDEQLSDLDAGVTALGVVRAKLKQYWAAVLKAAVEGALTADWRVSHPDAEPASELMKRILVERRRRWEEAQFQKFKDGGKEAPKNWKAKYKAPKAPVIEGLPRLPTGWCWVALGQLSDFTTSGSRGWAEFYSESGPLFIRSQDIRTDRLLLEGVARVRPPSSTEGARTRVRSGDLLITVTGANVAKAALVDRDLDEAYVSQHVGLTRFVTPEVGPFVHAYVTAPSGGRKTLLKLAYGAGKPGLNLDNLRDLAVPFPPLAEQERIAEAVEDQLSVISHLRADLDAKLKNAQALRQSMLRSAFAGKLVPQDPSDEPASDLLKRIGTEREERARRDTEAKRAGKRATRPASHDGRPTAKAVSTGEAHGLFCDR